MPSNPFARKRSPLDEARRRLDAARDDTAEAARNVRDAADEVVKTLEKGTAGRRVPVLAATAAAALGIGLYVAKRLAGSSEPELPDTPPPSADALTRPAASDEAKKAGAVTG